MKQWTIKTARGTFWELHSEMQMCVSLCVTAQFPRASSTTATASPRGHRIQLHNVQERFKSYNLTQSPWAGSVIESSGTAGQGVTTLPQTLVKETDEHHSKAGRTHFGLTNSSGIMSCASLCGSSKMTAAEMLGSNTLRHEQRERIRLAWLFVGMEAVSWTKYKNRKLEIWVELSKIFCFRFFSFPFFINWIFSHAILKWNQRMNYSPDRLFAACKTLRPAGQTNHRITQILLPPWPQCSLWTSASCLHA